MEKARLEVWQEEFNIYIKLIRPGQLVPETIASIPYDNEVRNDVDDKLKIARIMVEAFVLCGLGEYSEIRE